MVHQAVSFWGTIDILVNTAGTHTENVDFWTNSNKSSKHVPELFGTVYVDLNDVLEAVKDQMRIVEKKANFLLMTQAKVLAELNEQ